MKRDTKKREGGESKRQIAREGKGHRKEIKGERKEGGGVGRRAQES